MRLNPLLALSAFALLGHASAMAADPPVIGLVTKTETCLLYTSPSPRDS